jgi:hypothetical protein
MLQNSVDIKFLSNDQLVRMRVLDNARILATYVRTIVAYASAIRGSQLVLALAARCLSEFVKLQRAAALFIMTKFGELMQ